MNFVTSATGIISIAAIHMFVETVFWFHPLVWWIGKRMVEERERACDEEVLRLGSEPRRLRRRDSQCLQSSTWNRRWCARRE